ncbi:hypothetical protein Cpir12675_006611 [Ceratocystis pirilliformis]|uniref:Uncharacterized protein n=1 Tax=Ceratocystis pirilliformis TaxID=259994 RepID=A0ABR3YHG7_9PEZI
MKLGLVMDTNCGNNGKAVGKRTGPVRKAGIPNLISRLQHFDTLKGGPLPAPFTNLNLYA